MIRFHLLTLAAWIRGLCYRWPRQAPIPRGYSGVSCGFRDFNEVRAMWAHGWEPWCFQTIRGYGCHGTARLFRVRLTRDEREWEEARERGDLDPTREGR